MGTRADYWGSGGRRRGRLIAYDDWRVVWVSGGRAYGPVELAGVLYVHVACAADVEAASLAAAEGYDVELVSRVCAQTHERD